MMTSVARAKRGCATLVLGVSVITTLTAEAGDVELAAARCAAENLVQQRGVHRAALSDAVQGLSDTDGTALGYCFVLDPAGYVVVSADTLLPPVLAYSFAAAPGDLNDAANPLGALLVSDLRARRAQSSTLPADVRAARAARWAAALAGQPPAPGRLFEQWPPAGSTPTEGWVLTNWHQSAPYNNLCPIDSSTGQHSAAGCPAVAMAQVLNYHARLNATQFDDSDDYYHNYGVNKFWIDDAWAARGFPSFPQLNTHLNALFEHYFYGTTPSSTRRAALVFACGVAAQQVYSSSGSGTFGVAQAMDAYLRFGCATAELLDAGSPDLAARLSQNMMDALPAHLAVVNDTWTVGHNVVVDGYNTDEFYHVNFGWGGSYNGWYLLPDDLPYELTVIEGVIVDILAQPCGGFDATCDGHVDRDDLAYLGGCLAGPLLPWSAPGCTAFDGDDDGDVDLRDGAAFQLAFSP